MTATADLAHARQGQLDKAALIAQGKRKKPLTASIRVVLDAETVGAWEEARGRLEEALKADDKDKAKKAAVVAARAEVDQAEPAMRDAVATYWLRGIPHHEFEQLKVDHPPTDEQRAAGDEWDAHSLMPCLIAACLFDQDSGESLGFTGDDVAEMTDGWNATEIEAMYNVALVVNMRMRTVDIPKESAPTRS